MFFCLCLIASGAKPRFASVFNLLGLSTIVVFTFQTLLMSENSPPNESSAKTSLGDQEENHGAMNGDSAVDNNSASGSLTPGEIEPNEKKARTTEDDPAEPSTEKAEQIVPGIEEASENVEEKKGESASADVPETTNEEKPEDFITVKVAYNKTIYDTKIAKSKTVLDLKKELQVRNCSSAASSDTPAIWSSRGKVIYTRPTFYQTTMQ